jgi:hypothetical protein
MLPLDRLQLTLELRLPEHKLVDVACAIVVGRILTVNFVLQAIDLILQ